ncbi:Permease of the drug/metabolite transporter (DMT) superfamily [hydrothermal vent metagenome]|uniref:Permease of the drug/metabolite transporter (DMT) superfamily n=1 Tax=hydrothermal vent metagenome TaxID=652676 RepID=A0A3B0ZVT8_9ZZZZ
MKAVFNNPLFLLIATGTLFGLYFPLGKVAGEIGISAIAWALVVSVGACLVLLPILIVKRSFKLPRGATLRYVGIAGLISFVVPNILLFSVIPHVGAGYTGLMFALSPVFTLAVALIFKLKGPNLVGVIGIALGCIGAVVTAYGRGLSADATTIFWLGAALLIPLVLASANVYRTIDWPEGACPDSLAFWSHLVSIIILVVLLLSIEGTEALYPLYGEAALTMTQALLAGLTFPLYFRLQRYGGPVMLSQVGYVAAVVGMLTATVLLNEQYGFLTWVGAAIIAMGIAATIYSQISVVGKKAPK